MDMTRIVLILSELCARHFPPALLTLRKKSSEQIRNKLLMTEYLDPIPTHYSKSSISKFSESLAREFEFEIGDALEPLVEELGGTILYGHSSIEEVDGGSIFARDFDDFEIILSEYTSPARDRFTIAHELGHLFLHLQRVKDKDSSAGMRATRWVDNKDQNQQRAEWEANWFAAAFLMPEKEFMSTIEQHDVVFAAAKFNVSQSAANVRLSSLDR